VYVTPLGETSGALYGAVVESLQHFPPIHPRGSKDSLIFVRFLNRLPRWAKDGQPWLEFQPYKQVLGVLGVTQCHDGDDVAVAEEAFRTVCSPYAASLCDSKCVVYGSKSELEEAILCRRDFLLVEFDNSQSFSKPDVKINVSRLEKVVTDFAESIFMKLQQRIRDLKTKMDMGKMDMLRSPVDGKETENEEEGRLPRTQLVGRYHKHIADLHLLCGQLQSACTHFAHAITQLSRDCLWVGSANEGLGATFIMKSRQDEVFGLKTAALSVQSNLLGGFLKVSAKITGPRLSLKATHIDLPRRKGSAPPDVIVGGGAGAEANGAITNVKTSLYKPKGYLGDMQGDSLECIEDDIMDVSDLPPGEEASVEPDGDEEELERKLLQKDLVVDRFTRAELNYKKAGTPGGVPRIELLFKFARYLVSQKRHKAATEVLQRIFWTVSFIDDQDKTTLYVSIGKVFASMGYHRKASLFTYWASLHLYNTASIPQDCYIAHNLLTQCLPGFNLSTVVNTVAETTTSAPSGWPLLQAEVLKDFVFLTQETNQNGMFIQLGCTLLQNLHVHLDKDHLDSIVQHLGTITRTHALNNGQSSPAQSPKQPESPHRRLTRNLSTDHLLSPLPLTEFPRIFSFRPKQFPPHLRPHRTSGATTKGPFIVSHLHGKKHQRPEILWVIHDPAEIAMDITNPLDFELRVENMKLLWEGVVISACPSSLSLPACDKQDFTLTALPKEVGELQLIGYEHTVFGVRSKCRIKIAGNPLIKVVPTLPQLRLNVLPPVHAPRSQNGGDTASAESSPLQRGEGHRSSVGPKIEIDMMDGEKCHVEFKLECQKTTSIESLSLTLECSSDKENHKPEEFCHFECPTSDDINSLLPITKTTRRNFFVKINTKFPNYYRVKNDFVYNLTKQTSHSDRGTPYILEESVLETQRQPFKKKSSPFRSSANKRSQQGNSPPSSSPIAKRPPEAGRYRLFSKLPREHVMPCPPGYMDTPKLMDSLNIDFPQTSKVDGYSSLPRTKFPSVVDGIMSPMAHRRGFSRTGSTKSSHWKESEWDFNQFLDKRASIRSDPGDRKREGSGLLNRSPRSSGMSTPVTSLTGRTGSLIEDSEYSVLEFDRTNSPRLSGGPQKSPARTNVRKGATSINKNVISLPSDLRHNPLAILPTEVSVLGEFTLRYSGGEGSKVGYHREMVASVRVKVQPSLYFEEFNVALIEGQQSSFLLSFYVHNKSRHSLNVTCSYKKSEEDAPEQYKVSLRSKQKHRMEMTLRRFNMPGSSALHIINESNTAQLYSDHLAKMVGVQWEVQGVNRSGVATLEGMRLPSSLLHLIQPVPLLMDVKVNGNAFSPDAEEYCIGTPVSICLTLTNNAGELTCSFFNFCVICV
jgi:hypothetical protein